VDQLFFDLMKRRFFKSAAKSAAITAPFLLLVVYAYFRFFGAYLPSYGKGGVGIVGYNSYVMTAGDVNAVICGSEHWAGRSRLDSETVSCSGARVTPFRVSDMLNGTLLLRFTPTQIRVFDFKRLEGGYYLRKTEEDKPPSYVHEGAPAS
jgi:hypothetical protein